MHTFNITGIIILFTAFFVEFCLMIIHRPDKEVIKDSLANFVLGVLIILTGIFEKAVAFSIFSIIYHFAVFSPPQNWWLWVIAFFSCDLVHYMYHWLGHKTRIFWAAHVTHHSSKHFNLSIGLRTNFLHLFYRFLFWSPVCFLGIPPEMVLLFESISAIQNFLVHTEKIGRLGIIDRIFNTPSNHRVHHGSNPEYLDKNLGGMLMIYDHLFGTYAKETTKPVYGITHNIETNNPVKILLHEYGRIISSVSKIPGLLPKIRYLFSPP